jgi:hypothetical protein
MSKVAVTATLKPDGALIQAYTESRDFTGEHDSVQVGSLLKTETFKAVYNVPFTFKRLKANAGAKWVTLGALTNHVRGPRDEHGRSLTPKSQM